MIIKTPEVTKEYTVKTKNGIIRIVPLSYEPEQGKAQPCGCTDYYAKNYDPLAEEECDPSTCIYLAED